MPRGIPAEHPRSCWRVECGRTGKGTRETFPPLSLVVALTISPSARFTLESREFDRIHPRFSRKEEGNETHTREQVRVIINEQLASLSLSFVLFKRDEAALSVRRGRGKKINTMERFELPRNDDYLKVEEKATL